MAFTTDITQLESVFATKQDVSSPKHPPVGSWIIDFEKEQRVTSFTTDGLTALKQAIRIMLGTERLFNIIYSTDFGQEFNIYLNTQDSDYMVAILPTLIQNTLLVDDRIIECEVRNINRNMNMLTCDILLNTIFGDVRYDKYEVQV